MEIVIFENKEGEYEKLLGFLELVDKDFYPPLSARFDSTTGLNEYLDRLVNEGVVIYLVQNNKIAGLIGYYYFSEKHEAAYINTIAVSSDFRGRGLGKLLMEKCLFDLKIKSIKKVKVKTWSTNDVSTKLYEKLGFKVHGTVKDDRDPGVDSVYFEKEL